MKKELKKKLSLNKETVSSLNKSEMDEVKGGIVTTIGKGCKTEKWCQPTAIYCDTGYFLCGTGTRNCD